MLVVSTLLAAFGQLLFKLGLASQISLPYIGIGLLFYALSTVIFLYILGRMHLSWVYGLGGMSYIFASLLALFVLGEQISALRWLGIGVIAIGTALVGIS